MDTRHKYFSKYVLESVLELESLISEVKESLDASIESVNKGRHKSKHQSLEKARVYDTTKIVVDKMRTDLADVLSKQFKEEYYPIPDKKK